MKVYHGSLQIVSNPEIRVSDRTLDYGSGFYTTTDFNQARRWVDFVHENRTNRGFEHDYDFVYGPVANDKVYAAFALYRSHKN